MFAACCWFAVQLEDLFTDGAPAHLLDSLTEVLLRDPVKVDGCIYSRSSLVDLGWKHPITQEVRL